MNQYIPALKEGLKEAIRVTLMAIVATTIEQLSTGEINYKALGIVAGITLLRFVDKVLHEIGKDTTNTILKGGLTRF